MNYPACVETPLGRSRTGHAEWNGTRGKPRASLVRPGTCIAVLSTPSSQVNKESKEAASLLPVCGVAGPRPYVKRRLRTCVEIAHLPVAHPAASEGEERR